METGQPCCSSSVTACVYMFSTERERKRERLGTSDRFKNTDSRKGRILFLNAVVVSPQREQPGNLPRTDSGGSMPTSLVTQ